jgi:hypothetical protein
VTRARSGAEASTPEIVHWITSVLGAGSLGDGKTPEKRNRFSVSAGAIASTPSIAAIVRASLSGKLSRSVVIRKSRE